MPYSPVKFHVYVQSAVVLKGQYQRYYLKNSISLLLTMLFFLFDGLWAIAKVVRKSYKWKFFSGALMRMSNNCCTKSLA